MTKKRKVQIHLGLKIEVQIRLVNVHKAYDDSDFKKRTMCMYVCKFVHIYSFSVMDDEEKKEIEDPNAGCHERRRGLVVLKTLA